MTDFRLLVFKTVAKRLSFSKAADELFITQPAVTKHIHELEKQFKIKLFDRNGSRIKLTQAGKILLKHTEKIFAIYQNIEFEISGLLQNRSGTLRIGASTTVAQYVLPKYLAEFNKKYPEVSITLMVNNTEHIENALLNKEIDLGIIEGKSKNNSLKYREFLKDKIVLVGSNKSKAAIGKVIKPTQLVALPLVLREPGSGTLEVLADALKRVKINLQDLQVQMQLSGSESIKSYLLHSEALAFLSLQCIQKEIEENTLRTIQVQGLEIKRNFYFIQLHGDIDALPSLFIKFALRYNN